MALMDSDGFRWKLMDSGGCIWDSVWILMDSDILCWDSNGILVDFGTPLVTREIRFLHY